MSSADWQNLAVTVIGVFALATASRLVKRRWEIPAVSPWLVLVPYNVLWATLLIAARQLEWGLPAFAMPVALVGGNAALANLFGLPILRPLLTRKRPSAARAKPEDGREKLIPRPRKKKRQKRRR